MTFPILPTLLLLAGAAQAAEPLDVAFLYQSPVGDVGWVARHEAARRALEAEFGAKIKTRFVQDVKVGADGGRVMRDLVATGSGLVVLGSFGFMDEGLKTAADAPEVSFVHASGYKTAPNFGTYNARWYEGGYVAGVVAAKMTRSNLLGVVGAMPIPDVVSTINAYALGARSVNPAVQVRVVWVNEWFNPVKEAEAAGALIHQGADVLVSAFQDSPSVVKTAEGKGVWAIGMFSDMTAYAPKRLLTSITHDWTPYLRQVVTDRLAGRYAGAPYWASLKDGGVGLLAWNAAVPAALQEQARQVAADIAAGRLLPFAGPLKDSAGKPRVPAAKAASDAEIASMNWFVEGVQGALPQ